MKYSQKMLDQFKEGMDLMNKDAAYHGQPRLFDTVEQFIQMYEDTSPEALAEERDKNRACL